MSVDKRVVGLDLSLTGTGIAHPDGTTETIRTKHRGCERLIHIRDHITAAIWPHRVPANLVVIEDYAYSRAAAHSHELGELGGVVRVALHERGIPFVCVGPSSLKKFATGKGNADKHAMRIAAYKTADLEFDDDNQCDAAWLRWMGLYALIERPGGAPPVPATAYRDETVAKIAWPVPSEARP